MTTKGESQRVDHTRPAQEKLTAASMLPPCCVSVPPFLVSLKAVGIQVGLMAGISLGVTLAFSFFRPREKKVYAPKVKYRDEAEEAAPPPTVRSADTSDLITSHPRLT